MTEQNNARGLAQTWLEAADQDMRFAELGLQEDFYVLVCFHCQQAAEKALKAYLLAQGRGVIRTHSLPRLQQECLAFDHLFSGIGDDCARLTGYYTATRYPDTFDALDEYDANTAREAAVRGRRVLSLVQTALSDLLSQGGAAQ